MWTLKCHMGVSIWTLKETMKMVSQIDQMAFYALPPFIEAQDIMVMALAKEKNITSRGRLS